MKDTRKSTKINSKTPIETHCQSCDRETKHTPLFIYRVSEQTEYTDFVSDYMTLQCGGCETVSFCRREYPHDSVGDDEDFIDHNGLAMNGIYEDYTFLRDEDLDHLPRKIYDLYEEVRKTFVTESVLMAGVGLRMLVEAVCVAKMISGRNLQDKIKKLHSDGLISAVDLPILDKLRLIGNDSAHNFKPLSLDKLAYALDIINHILKSIYVMPKINKKLKL